MDGSQNRNAAFPGPSFSLLAQRSARFTILSMVWIFPSAGAILILWKNRIAWKTSAGLQEFFSSIRLEDWTAFFLLLTQVVFIAQAVKYQRLCRKMDSGLVENEAASGDNESD